MNQLAQIDTDKLFFLAQQFDDGAEVVLPQENNELLQIFHMYNAQDFYTKVSKLHAGGTKCSATGTCMMPPIVR